MEWRRFGAFVDLQVLEDEASGSFSAQQRRAQNQLLFERAEEALAGGVVPAVPFAAHAAGHSVRVEDHEVFGAAVLAAAVAVVQKAAGRATSPQRHLERRQDQLLIDVFAHRPADDATRKQIEHHRQIQPALRRPQIRDVLHPDSIRGARGKVAGEQIGSDGECVFRVGGALKSSLP